MPHERARIGKPVGSYGVLPSARGNARHALRRAASSNSYASRTSISLCAAATQASILTPSTNRSSGMIGRCGINCWQGIGYGTRIGVAPRYAAHPGNATTISTAAIFRASIGQSDLVRCRNHHLGVSPAAWPRQSPGAVLGQPARALRPHQVPPVSPGRRLPSGSTQRRQSTAWPHRDCVRPAHLQRARGRVVSDSRGPGSHCRHSSRAEPRSMRSTAVGSSRHHPINCHRQRSRDCRLLG